MDAGPGRLLESDAEIAEALAGVRRVAVLGIKPEAQAHKPAFFVARALADAGLEIEPVPVYFPEIAQILGRRVHRRVADIPGGVDLVDVFRRPEDIPPHLPDLIAARPRIVWFQAGIHHDEAAQALAAAGIDVVQDRCLKIEWQRLGPRR